MVAFHKSRVYRYTRDLLRELKKKNYYLIAISHSYKEIVGSFAASWVLINFTAGCLPLAKTESLQVRLLIRI